jgi:hypothetical protein
MNSHSGRLVVPRSRGLSGLSPVRSGWPVPGQDVGAVRDARSSRYHPKLALGNRSWVS